MSCARTIHQRNAVHVLTSDAEVNPVLERYIGTLGVKVENNAAVYARSIAEQHGRNAACAEQAVRESVSAPTNEAVDKHIVDFAAEDVNSAASPHSSS